MRVDGQTMPLKETIEAVVKNLRLGKYPNEQAVSFQFVFPIEGKDYQNGLRRGRLGLWDATEDFILTRALPWAATA